LNADSGMGTSSAPTIHLPLPSREPPLARDPSSKERKKVRTKKGGPGGPGRVEILFGEMCGRLSKSGHIKTTLDFKSYEKRLSATLKALGGLKVGPDRLLLVLDHWLLGPDSWKRDTWPTAANLLSKLLRSTKTRDNYLPEALEWDAMGRPGRATQSSDEWYEEQLNDPDDIDIRGAFNP